MTARLGFYDGFHVRLRPVAQPDYHQLFDFLAGYLHPRLRTARPPALLFEDWRQSDLPGLAGAGPLFLIEDVHGVLAGIIRLHRIDQSDGVAFLDTRPSVSLEAPALKEALFAVVQYGFDVLGLRKIYAEADSTEHLMFGPLDDLGFQTEVALRDYLANGSGFADLLYLGLHSDAWVEHRDIMVASLDLSRAAEQLNPGQ